MEPVIWGLCELQREAVAAGCVQQVLVEQALGHGDTSGGFVPLCPALTGIL